MRRSCRWRIGEAVAGLTAEMQSPTAQLLAQGALIELRSKPKLSPGARPRIVQLDWPDKSKVPFAPASGAAFTMLTAPSARIVTPDLPVLVVQWKSKVAPLGNRNVARVCRMSNTVAIA